MDSDDMTSPERDTARAACQNRHDCMSRMPSMTHANTAPDEPRLDRFCDTLWLEDGLSRHTIDSYRSDLRLFAKWLAASCGKSLAAADHGDIQAYLGHRLSKRTRVSSAARLLSSLK